MFNICNFITMPVVEAFCAATSTAQSAEPPGALFTALFAALARE